MKNLSGQYEQHIKMMNARASEIIEQSKVDGLLIHSGRAHRLFLDDMDYLFKVNPHFKAWLPVLDSPDCWLQVNGKDKPRLILYRAVDFWHARPAEPDPFWAIHFDVVMISDLAELRNHIKADRKRHVYIGEFEQTAKDLGIVECNTPEILHFFHYHRAYKTDYEISCLREANRLAVLGHEAVKDAFYKNQSEFELTQTYLTSVSQSDYELPYQSIIAHNENAAVLHYHNRQRSAPSQIHSLLIDAGVDFHGYASDISRTYSYEKGEFAELIAALDAYQQKIIQDIKVGHSYIDLHQQMNRYIAQMMIELKFSTASVEQLIEEQVVKAFFPHGLGHLLGLQVHDMGGRLISPYLGEVPPKDVDASLRNHRLLEPKQVMTIEPGFYFIEQLLKPLRESKSREHLNWDMIERMMPYGGIRIEDNIAITDSGVENLTRTFGLNDL